LGSIKKAGQSRTGKTVIAPKTWHHVALVRRERQLAAYLDGRAESEVAIESDPVPSPITIGGDPLGLFRFEGKIDEVAIYDRALTPVEIQAHFRASGVQVASRRPFVPTVAYAT